LPGGICLDAEGAVWVASPNTKQVVRVAPSGKIVQRISTRERGALACMLGGAQRRMLYIAMSPRCPPFPRLDRS
jgi:sugar lactone lactonase YvrE